LNNTVAVIGLIDRTTPCLVYSNNILVFWGSWRLFFLIAPWFLSIHCPPACYEWGWNRKL